MFRQVGTVAVFVLLSAVPAAAQEQWFGSFHPALNVSFNGGITEYHNAIGASVGAHIAPLRVWRFRFPTVGGDVLLANKCPAYAPDDSECYATLGLQVASGIDFITKRKNCHDGAPLEEHALSIQLARVVVGPLRGDEGWGLKIGYSVRY